jgi:rod shape-determining protein MreC
MESLINRYRNVTVLVLVILAQLVLVAVQVKNDQDVRMIRVWAVTAVTPLARTLEGMRSGTFGFLNGYILLRSAYEESRQMKTDLDRLKMENLFLKSELATADRAKALSVFQARTPSRTLAARVIATGAGAGSKVVFIDRGSLAGVERGMGVVTPDGIVGKVIAAYPTASEVLLITDADFAAGIVSQKNHVQGTLKGQGFANCKLDYVPNEEKLEAGEMLFTSGDDRIFPKGFPAGVVRVVRSGSQFKDIFVEPTGLQHGLEEVLVLLEGMHQAIPNYQAESAPVYLAPPPPGNPAQPAAGTPPNAPVGTEADHLMQHYKDVGAAQGHKFGEGLPGSKAPDFNLKVPAASGAPAAAPGAAVPARAPAGTVPQPKPAATPGAQPPAPATAVPPRSKPAVQTPAGAPPAEKKKPVPQAANPL